MSKLKQFESYFSKYCCVQLRNSVPLCRMKQGEKPRPSANFRVIDGQGMPVGGNGFPVEKPQPVPTFPVEMQREGSDLIFTLVLENCIMVPSPSMDRVVLGYRVDDTVLEVSVLPEEIVSVTVVAQPEVPRDSLIVS